MERDNFTLRFNKKDHRFSIFLCLYNICCIIFILSNKLNNKENIIENIIKESSMRKLKRGLLKLSVVIGYVMLAGCGDVGTSSSTMQTNNISSGTQVGYLCRFSCNKC